MTTYSTDLFTFANGVFVSELREFNGAGYRGQLDICLVSKRTGVAKLFTYSHSAPGGIIIFRDTERKLEIHLVP